MPELPEVEIVCRNLNEILKPPFKILSWKFFRKDLRFAIPIKKLESLIALDVNQIERRAKYIKITLNDQVIISHLGMTGSWRQESANWPLQKHDHVAFEFKPNLYLVYSDPRRFGFIEVVLKNKIDERFKDIGFEPLSITDVALVYEKFKQLSSPIKTALMNQKLIVGVGNIYASEVLFKAKISPFKKCSKIKLEEFARILELLKIILQKAIDQGGSTIENYKNSFGESGSFQNHFFVYGRDGLDCLICKNSIKKKVQAGRTTFWCAHCQK